MAFAPGPALFGRLGELPVEEARAQNAGNRWRYLGATTAVPQMKKPRNFRGFLWSG